MPPVALAMSRDASDGGDVGRGASGIEGMEVDKSLQSALINKIPNVTSAKAMYLSIINKILSQGFGSSFSMLTKNHTHFEVENNEEHDF